MDSSQGRLQITLLKELSGGTFARVYLAEATGGSGIKRIVAVKVLRTEWSDSQEFIARTKDEARMLSQLRHPNIVKVEDLAQLDGQLCLVMELVDGCDIQDLMEALKQRGKKLPPRTCYEIVAKVASALDAAWNKVPYGRDGPIRVVHRDVKPSNVMVTPDSEVKVLDFGTASGLFDEREASTKMFRFGSLKYMSPERREGDRGTHLGDTYSLGLMLMEMLQGSWLSLLPEPPEHSDAVYAAAQGISDTGMPAEDWDVAVRKVLRQMCADDPRHRPNAEQVAKLMRAFAEHADGPSLESFCSEWMPSLMDELRQPSTEEGELVGQRIFIGGSSEPIPIGRPQGTVPDTASPPTTEEPDPSGDHPLLRMAPPEETVPPDNAPPPPALGEEKTSILPISDPPQALSDDATQILSGIPPLDDDGEFGAPPPPPMAQPFVAPPPPPPAPPPPPVAAPAPPAWQPSQVSGDETQVFSAGQPIMPPGEVTTGPPTPRQTQPPPPDIQGPVAPEPETPPSPEPPSEEPKKQSGCGRLLGVGCLLIVLLTVCAGLGIGLRAMLNTGGDVEVAEEEGPASPETSDESADPTETPDGVEVAVNLVGDNIQWTRLKAPSGETRVKGDESGLEGAVPPGDYVLAVKVIGRPVVTASLPLAAPTTLACALQEDSTVICDGLAEALVLAP